MNGSQEFVQSTTPQNITFANSFFESGGWSGGAMVLCKLTVPGYPTHLDKSRARAYYACSRCGWGLFGPFFLSSIISLFFLLLSDRWPDTD